MFKFDEHISIVLATDALCVNTIMKDMDDERRKCTCNVQCDEEGYKYTISGSTFPALRYAVSEMFREKVILVPNIITYLLYEILHI